VDGLDGGVRSFRLSRKPPRHASYHGLGISRYLGVGEEQPDRAGSGDGRTSARIVLIRWRSRDSPLQASHASFPAIDGPGE
jgi:hypothetical protein